jgi:hypothetical protein
LDRENTAGEGITKKNPGARIDDREDNVSSLCGVTPPIDQINFSLFQIELISLLISDHNVSLPA